MTSRQRFLKACCAEPVDRLPVWLMRQAGRYLPEYRELKEKHGGFLTMVRTPELAAEVTLQPLRRFSLDAAILFSDILVIPEALGQPYRFRDTGGIAMEYLLDSSAAIERLDPTGIPEKLAYVGEALGLLHRELDQKTALLGFGGSPWTLATYMVENGGSGNASKTKALAGSDPKAFHALMGKLVTALTAHFRMQIEAGADAIQIFDSWGAACSAYQYQEFSLRWIAAIIQQLPPEIPVILFARGMAHHAPDLIATGTRVLSVDWTVRLSSLRRIIPPDIAIQGNLDPTLLNGTPECVRKQVTTILDDIGTTPGHIFNLGHGIQPTARIASVEALIETVHAHGVSERQT